MEPIAILLQRNPWVLGVLLVALPALTWAAAYGARPSRARRRVAVWALALSVAIGVVGAVAEWRAGEPWWPSLALAGFVAAVWLVPFSRAARKR